MLSDNGAVFTGIPRGGGRVALELELISLGVRVPALAALSPPDLRQGRTLPPDPETLARQPAPSRNPAGAPSPARQLPRLLQHHPTPPGPRASHPPRRLRTPAPRPRPPGPPSPTATTGSAKTASTTAAPSPCATTAGSTTSASADDTPANASSSSPTTSTSASSPKTANSSATSPSTPPATTNPNPNRERCRGTSVHDVPRHHRSGASGNRTHGLVHAMDALYQLSYSPERKSNLTRPPHRLKSSKQPLVRPPRS